MDTVPEAKPAIRRRHDSELKARVVAACDEPGASVAQVAMAHGLNANLVHKWRRGAEPEAPCTPAAFIELPLTRSGAQQPAADIRVELKRGATTVSVNWPADRAADCATWLRELLR